MSYEILTKKIKKDVIINGVRFLEFAYGVKRVKIKADHTVLSDDRNFGSGKITLSLRLGYNYFSCGENEFTLFRRLPARLTGKEKYRPKFHYTVPFSLLNDPNGLFYDDEKKRWNIYHQYQGNYTKNCENKSWAHAVSQDLITYEYLPVVMYPDNLGEIYSGSCVVDKNNTSGLFDSSTTPSNRIVAFYTAFDGIEKQCVAYSSDGGLTFKKYKGNPVLPNVKNGKQLYTLGYRDPKVTRVYTRHHKNGIWFMVVAGEQARLYTSLDLIHWTLNDEFVYPDGNKIVSECPDFFPMTDNRGKMKWVFIGNDYNDGNSYIFYTVGSLAFEGGKYKYAVERVGANSLNVNPECYASQTFSNAPDGRTVMLAWMRDWVLFDGNMWNFNKVNKKSKYWLGTLTLPVDLKLVDDIIKVFPSKELHSLRKKELRIKKKNGLYKLIRCGNLLEIDIEKTKNPVSVILKSGIGEKIVISAKNKVFVCDKSESKATSVKRYEKKLDSDYFSAKILIDASVIEGYLNEGETAFNLQYYITDLKSVEITADHAKVYKLRQTVKVKQL